MVLPLIPLIVIGVGAVSGAGGVALGTKGAYDLKKAMDSCKESEQRYSKQRARTERAVERTNDALKDLGLLQEESLHDVVLRMKEFLRRHQKQVRESERLLVDGVDATLSQVSASRRFDADTVAWVRGAIGSVGAGGGASLGVTALVSSYGAASTGTAITSLSGAAAQNATMAFLGGGSIASGGGGMALGATALNFVTVGPALLVGGFVIAGQGEKACTQAAELRARVNIEVAGMSETRSRLSVIDVRVEEVSHLLGRLASRAKEALDVLEAEPFDPTTHAGRFQNALGLVMAVRDIAATPVVDGAGALNEKTATFQIKYRALTENRSVEDV